MPNGSSLGVRLLAPVSCGGGEDEVRTGDAWRAEGGAEEGRSAVTGALRTPAAGGDEARALGVAALTRGGVVESWPLAPMGGDAEGRGGAAIEGTAAFGGAESGAMPSMVSPVGACAGRLACEPSFLTRNTVRHPVQRTRTAYT